MVGYEECIILSYGYYFLKEGIKLRNIVEILENKLKNTDKNNLLKIGFEKDLKYYKDFVELIEIFDKNLSHKQMEDLLDNKLLLNKKFNGPHYLQSVSEIILIYYVLRKYNDKFEYEPKYNGKKNPECAFSYNDTLINIEVKCPDLTSSINSEKSNTLKVYLPERIPNHNEIVNDIKSIITDTNKEIKLEEKKRSDNKLKDYLVSASNKFPNKKEKNFNILVISLDIISDLDEWYMYIFGQDGVFTNNSFIPKKEYENVDAILITNFMNAHRDICAYNKTNVWKMEEYINLLFLDPNKQNTEKGEFYAKYGIDMFGSITPMFLIFQKKLDDERKYNGKKYTNILQYCNDKMIQISIVSEFIKWIKDNKI